MWLSITSSNGRCFLLVAGMNTSQNQLLNIYVVIQPDLVLVKVQSSGTPVISFGVEPWNMVKGGTVDPPAQAALSTVVWPGI